MTVIRFPIEDRIADENHKGWIEPHDPCPVVILPVLVPTCQCKHPRWVPGFACCQHCSGLLPVRPNDEEAYRRELIRRLRQGPPR